jgi:hypothetical protein
MRITKYQKRIIDHPPVPVYPSDIKHYKIMHVDSQIQIGFLKFRYVPKHWELRLWWTFIPSDESDFEDTIYRVVNDFETKEEAERVAFLQKLEE